MLHLVIAASKQFYSSQKFVHNYTIHSQHAKVPITILEKTTDFSKDSLEVYVLVFC